VNAPYTVLQRLKACTSLAPAWSSVPGHALIVARVVKPSSTSRILPATGTLAEYVPAAFTRLPAAESST
jgi:hypothetical protein